MLRKTQCQEKQKKKTLEDKVEKLQEKIQSCEDKRYTSREQVLDVEQVEKYDEEIEDRCNLSS